MSRFLVAATPLLLLASQLPATAGLPPITRSGWSVSGQSSSCQFRFRGDGSLDCLTLYVTLRDQFDTPVPNCETEVTLSLVGPKPADGCWAAEPGADVCSCDGFVRTAVSDFDGTLEVVWCKIGGRGVGQVCITTQCFGQMAIGCEEFDFTSHDLSGSCSSSTTILSMALWVGCLPPSPPCQSSDYNCDCAVDVLDFAVWAGGLGRDCS